jgi:ribokinase
LEKLTAFARKKGINVAFNPSSYLAKKGINHVMKIIKNTNLLAMNREEAGYLAKTNDAAKAAKKLKKLGPNIVVVTDGKNKIAAYGDKLYSLKPHKANVVEATGAGDAFASSFLAGIIKGKDIMFSLKLALANSESVITHFGAKEKLLRWKDAVRKV